MICVTYCSLIAQTLPKQTKICTFCRFYSTFCANHEQNCAGAARHARDIQKLCTVAKFRGLYQDMFQGLCQLCAGGSQVASPNTKHNRKWVIEIQEFKSKPFLTSLLFLPCLVLCSRVSKDKSFQQIRRGKISCRKSAHFCYVFRISTMVGLILNF